MKKMIVSMFLSLVVGTFGATWNVSNDTMYVKTPATAQEAATKAYVDNANNALGDVKAGSVNTFTATNNANAAWYFNAGFYWYGTNFQNYISSLDWTSNAVVDVKDNTNNYQTAYLWGDHAGEGYLKAGSNVSALVNDSGYVSTNTFDAGTNGAVVAAKDYTDAATQGLQTAISGTVVTNGANISVLANDSGFASSNYSDNMATKTNFVNLVVDGTLNLGTNSMTNITCLALGTNNTGMGRIILSESTSTNAGIRFGSIPMYSVAAGRIDVVGDFQLSGACNAASFRGAGIHSGGGGGIYVNSLVSAKHVFSWWGITSPALSITNANGTVVFGTGLSATESTNALTFGAGTNLLTLGQGGPVEFNGPVLNTVTANVTSADAVGTTQSNVFRNAANHTNRYGLFTFQVISNVAPYNYSQVGPLAYGVTITNLFMFSDGCGGVVDLFTAAVTNPNARTLCYTGATYIAGTEPTTNYATTISVGAGSMLGAVCTNGGITNLFIGGQYRW
jgi:hypothetical protein